jgi:sulfhydrogenase subunit beta (sulfur reductase)
MNPIPIAERTPKYISRKRLIQWLDQIAGEMDLIAPCDVNGFILYRKVDAIDEVILDFSKPVLSIKDAFFSPTEQLFLIDKLGGEIKISEAPSPNEQVLFGVRPCDAHGLQALDAVFITTEPSDTYYTARRDNSILIGLVCREMGSTCFCTSMGSSPDDARYMDLMLDEVDGGYTLQIITERGRYLLDRFGVQPEATLPIKQEDKHYPVASQQYTSMESWPAQFSEPFWEEMAERCLSCRACAYVCPTCRCFDVRDEVCSGQDGRQEYARIRCWDSCTGEAYRRIAGGHNPRPTKGQRIRNRFYCKFYYFPLQYGLTACTGCGRCIDVCPVGVDITEVLQYMACSLIAEKNNPAEVGAI